jgi:hypothetical protein
MEGTCSTHEEIRNEYKTSRIIGRNESILEY